MEKYTQQEINELIAETARQTVRAYDAHRRACAAAATTHNATVLMENYNRLVSYANDGTVPQAGDDCLENIAHSRSHTIIMVGYIDTALEKTRKEYESHGQSYKWTAFKRKYIDGLSYEDIADELNSGKNSPARWCKEVMRRLSVHLFGVDGLKCW